MPLPTDGIGNISSNPLFVDAKNGDFRLQMDSPCIDAGANEYVVGLFDFDGKPRIRNGRVDMGAHEYDKLRPTGDIPVPVSFDWLDSYLGWRDVTNYVALATMQGENKMPFWKSYVAGCNPTNSESKFLITSIETDGEETPTLAWSPHLTNRVYEVVGKTNLTDELWHSPTNSGTRFFKVNVTLPQAERK